MNEILGNSNARFLEIGPNSWFSSPRFVSWNYHRHVDTILWAFFKIRSHLRDWAYTKVWHKPIWFAEFLFQVGFQLDHSQNCWLIFSVSLRSKVVTPKKQVATWWCWGQVLSCSNQRKKKSEFHQFFFFSYNWQLGVFFELVKFIILRQHQRLILCIK